MGLQTNTLRSNYSLLIAEWERIPQEMLEFLFYLNL